MSKLIPFNTTEVKRSYYLNLFSANAEKIEKGVKNSIFRWNIRDLQLGSIAEIGLVQLFALGASTSTAYTIRCLETYADGYDSYLQTAAILYMGTGLLQQTNPTYHKLISNNLNSITLVVTDDNTSATTVANGFAFGITFGLVLHIIDYADAQQTF